jgi:hypothetical protein
MTTTLTVEYSTRSHKFTLVGQEALGHTSATGKTVISLAEIAQIVKLHQMGVFQGMLDNHTIQQTVEVSDAAIARTIVVTEPPLPPPSPVAQSGHESPVTERSRSVSPNDDSSTSSTGSTRGNGLVLWNKYLKDVKAQNPDLTVAQAKGLAKATYHAWKLTQA